MTGYVAIGSNLGDRGEHLASGLAGLRANGLAPTAVSSVWETEPVGLDDAGPFWNMAVAFESDEAPHRLLDRLLAIERSAGRRRSGRLASRTLDLDLLLLGDLSIVDDRLHLPHPRMWERSFVLAPLAEIAPELRNPATGRTVTEELRRIPRPTAVSRICALDHRPTILL
jgi:2-amino-4-hydroxy-6-hydroxymethyldihydropteridine diphosphokinase